MWHYWQSRRKKKQKNFIIIYILWVFVAYLFDQPNLTSYDESFVQNETRVTCPCRYWWLPLFPIPHTEMIIFVKTFCILIVAKAYVAALFPPSFYLVQYMPKLTLSWFSILMDHGANIIPHEHSCCVKALLGVSSFLSPMVMTGLFLLSFKLFVSLVYHCTAGLFWCFVVTCSCVFFKHAFLRGVISVCLFTSWCSMALTSRLDTSLVILLSVGKTMFERTKSRSCLSFYWTEKYNVILWFLCYGTFLVTARHTFYITVNSVWCALIDCTSVLFSFPTWNILQCFRHIFLNTLCVHMPLLCLKCFAFF